MNKLKIFNQNKKFFIDDVEKIKAYVNQYCDQETCRKIIDRADEAVNQSFRFDLRWDMEYTQTPVKFDNEINWLTMPDDDPEWIFAFNRHHFWVTLGQAYVLTGNEKYAKAFVNQCRSWIQQVQLTDPDCAQACRSLEMGLRMNLWIKALCLFQDSPSLTETFYELFESSIHQQEKAIYELWNTTKIISNWGVLENHGLFTAAVLMPETELSEKMIQTSLERLNLQLQHQVYPDGVHWEQSMMYHNEVTQDFLEVKILADRNGITLPEGFNEKLKKMIEFCVQHKKPNGDEVSMGDSDDIDVRDIISKAGWAFQEPTFKHEGYPQFDFDCVFDLGYQAAQEYQKLESKTPSQKSVWFKESGHIFFHSEYSEDQTYLHFYNGVHGGGHAHEDKLHINLFYRGEDILRDSGRLTYVDKPERYEFKGPEAHNVVILDDQPSIICKRSWGFTKRALSTNTEMVVKGDIRFAQGSTLGYYDLSTGTALINRKVIMIGDDLVLVNDEIYANPNDQHKISMRWHLAPGAEVVQDQRCVRVHQQNSVTEVLTLCEGISTEVIESRVSLHYNTTTPSQVIVSNQEQAGFASILTIFSLNPKGQEETCYATSIPVHFVTRPDRPFEKQVLEAWLIKKGDKEITVAIAHEDYLGPSDTFTCNGKLGMGHVTVWTLEDHDEWGTTLTY